MLKKQTKRKTITAAVEGRKEESEEGCLGVEKRRRKGGREKRKEGGREGGREAGRQAGYPLQQKTSLKGKECINLIKRKLGEALHGHGTAKLRTWVPKADTIQILTRLAL